MRDASPRSNFAADPTFSGYAGNPVAFQTCSNKDGNSGYLVIENLGDRSADICWTVIFNNGKQDRGCHSNMGPGKERISCYYCGTKHGGIKTVQLTKYAIKP